MYGINILGNCLPQKQYSLQMTEGEFCFQNKMINKFSDDKAFYHNDGYIVCLDGVITNKASIISKSMNLPHYLINEYKKNGDNFFSVLRGSFAGCLYDIQNNKLVVFSDQLGTKFVYYYYQEGKFICSQEFDDLVNILKCNSLPVQLNKEAAELVICNGFTIEEKTICNDVNKIEPGHYLVLQNGKLTISEYYSLPIGKENNDSEEVIISNIDKLFRQAIKRQFDKDKEYGYKHLVALSGGLDCRMTSFVADDLGYKQQINCTFSQTKYLDQTIAQDMASSMKHEWLFKSLDNGLWLYDVDKCVKMTGGNVAYTTIAHTDSFYKYLNFDRIGLLHTGQLGDVTIGSKYNKKIEYDLRGASFTPSLLNKIVMHHKKYSCMEEGLFYHRYLTGTNFGLQNLYHYTESLSPFLDIDFLEYVLSIPYSIRYNHYIYIKWINRCYPQAGSFVWESTGTKISVPHLRIAGRYIPISLFLKKLSHRVIPVKNKLNSSNGMNPYEFYYLNNHELREYLEGYRKYIASIDDADICKLINFVMDKGAIREKLQAITLLSAIKQYFYED